MIMTFNSWLMDVSDINVRRSFRKEKENKLEMKAPYAVLVKNSALLGSFWFLFI
jgi:hypothetical protein